MQASPRQHERRPTGLRKVTAGHVLFLQGARCQGLYSVRSGTFKSVFSLADGREQVCGFPMVGDVIGLDGMAAGQHGTTMVALEDTHVSLMALPGEPVFASDPETSPDVMTLVARDLQRAHLLHALLGRANAQERLAVFLLDQSRRWQAQGYSPCDLQLRMSRAEIGSYLCMSMETVSRTLSTMQRKGWLRVDRRSVLLTDVASFSRRFAALP